MYIYIYKYIYIYIYITSQTDHSQIQHSANVDRIVSGTTVQCNTVWYSVYKRSLRESCCPVESRDSCCTPRLWISAHTHVDLYTLCKLTYKHMHTVRTTASLITYQASLDPKIRVAHLDFEGKNSMVYKLWKESPEFEYTHLTLESFVNVFVLHLSESGSHVWTSHAAQIYMRHSWMENASGLGSGESRCRTGRGCCRVLQRSRTGVYELLSRNERITVSLQCVAVCCSMLHYVAVCQWIHGLLDRE